MSEFFALLEQFLAPLDQFVTQQKLPLGRAAKGAVDWLTDNAAFFFDIISNFLSMMIEFMLFIIGSPPPLLAILIIFIGSYFLRRNWRFSALVLLGLLLIHNQGYWEETTETLSLVLCSTMLCMIIGVPIGILGARKPRFFAVVRPILDLMQTIPTFVYLIPALILFGLGMVPGLIATIIFTLPAPIRLTQIGISSTPRSLIEAVEAFGATDFQRLWKVEFPHAKPQILAGLTQAIMLSLSMVVIAALVGAEGLGVPTLRALNQVNIAKGFEAGLAIVLVAIILDRFFALHTPQGSERHHGR